MNLAPGQDLLHYRLIEQIGEGGMGVVWRANDTKLGRDVAIKLLPEALSADSERLQRFEREARVLASLNHAHIATIHGLHELPREGAQPIRFLVMELVEGEDLQQRIERGPIPLARAIEIGKQVAVALEAAHAQGVVHRDLKPANVKLTVDGDAKVLDFGLAKALAPETGSGEGTPGPTMSPTITSAGTAAGMILGTAAFMSPEQARGKAVDRRADLWAFGCVLYEMLTGRRCFDGETVSDTLASVLKEQPDWSRLPDGTPPALRRLLRRCLAKDPRQRLGDAGTVRLELTEALEPAHPEEQLAAPTVAPAAEPAAGSKLPWVVAAVAVIAAVGAWMVGGRTAPTAPPRAPLKLAIPIPSEITLNDDQESLFDLSADGRYVVFGGLGAEAMAPSLYLRNLGDSAIVKLPDTLGAINPFFSPDGRWVGFFADGQLRKLQIGSETAMTICSMTGGARGASWGADDMIVYPGNFIGGLMQVRGSGGEPTPLTELDADRKERTHRWPQVVPGHDVVLFTVATTDSPEFYDDAHIDAVRLSTGERKTVFEGASFARYVPTGHLVFGRGGFLFAVPFDIDRLEATGTPTPVEENVMGVSVSGVVYASVSQTGLLAYVAGKPVSPRRRLAWMQEDGRTEPVAGAEIGWYANPAVSPDGKRIALGVAGDRAFDIWVFDLERASRTRLTFEGDDSWPIWTRDGKSVAFSSIRNGQMAAYLTAADGAGGERLIHAAEGYSVGVTDVSWNGRLAILTIGDNKGDIYVKSLVDPEADAVPFLASPADEDRGRFSPDGRWIAYTSDESGDYHVFVRPYPGPGGRWQISSRGGVHPRWSPDGRRIHYRINREWWVVDVDPGNGDDDSLRTGVPRLVRDDMPRTGLTLAFGVSPDAGALLEAVPSDDPGTPEEITVVVDWLADLERRVPR